MNEHEQHTLVADEDWFIINVLSPTRNGGDVNVDSNVANANEYVDSGDGCERGENEKEQGKRTTTKSTSLSSSPSKSSSPSPPLPLPLLPSSPTTTSWCSIFSC